ncbi:MAG: hypothetical protein KatS3mg131_3695 [Candidatus Tectimicrobiota bacterium]|nr:MAG: hypothetical protein KatS3mg131_3695 [Candidatus Tectomicrobia bacterium]
MHYDEFVIRVQHEAGLDTPEEAVQAIRATLETLGERLDNPEKAQLASELPKELRAFLEQHPQHAGLWP